MYRSPKPLDLLALILVAAALPALTRAQAPAATKHEDGYVLSAAPKFAIPPCKGQHYEDQAPATLELAEMAELALNGMTGPNDHALGEELYFVVNWFTNPTKMYHDFSSACQSEFLGPLALNRIISGSLAHQDVERRIIEFWLRGMGEDGLYHAPIKGRPWHRHGWEGSPWGGGKQLTEVEALALNAKDPAYGGGSLPLRFLEALMIYSLRDPNPLWKEMMKKIVHNRAKALVDKGDWGYYGSPDKPPTGFSAADGWLPQALAQYYRLTGDPEARETSRKLVYFLKDHSENFDAEGRFLTDAKFFHQRGPHFYALSNCVLAMLEYGLAADDPTMKAFARKSFEWARGQGAPAIGFFPEFNEPANPNSEGCVVADMITLAMMLSNGGLGDHWDDADRWIRNYFAEIQLTPEKGALLEKFARSRPPEPVPYNATADNVTRRNIGAFAGWPGANEFADHIGIQHCCTGNCSRAIYYIWENILGCKDGELRVNLLLNRAAPWADLYSCIPYEGRVELKVKQPLKAVRLRLPEWIATGDKAVQCAVGGKSRKLTWEGRIVNIGAADAGDRVKLTFPIGMRTVKEKIGGREYELTIKGNTVVAIDPPGKNCPLFNRGYFKQNKAPWRTIQRFVSAERIVW